MKNNNKAIINLAVFSLAFFLMYFFVFNIQDNYTKVIKNKTDTNIKNILTKKIENKKYIEADLQKMELSLFDENHKLVKTFPIATKGLPGSYYETPAGDFEIKNKTENRYSNMGNVYMPYAMQFFGNFFIHGIPYYPDGHKVTSSYSGGCIRMQDSDMKEIYEFTDTNTKLIIKNKNISYSADQNIDKNFAENMMMILISLEVINQENTINFDNKTITFKELNYYIAKGDEKAKQIILDNIGKNIYQNYTKERLESLGLENLDNKKNIDSLISYIINNKNYILKYF